MEGVQTRRCIPTEHYMAERVSSSSQKAQCDNHKLDRLIKEWNSLWPLRNVTLEGKQFNDIAVGLAIV